ncbi:MAG: hypothetical protein KIS76_05830 [Pyrinomonadaceae bacterium]|nr:hypothetical protein [Pyrinomonadaceae bacterium]
MLKFKKIFLPIVNKETIARRSSIDELQNLREKFGGDKWRKIKGEAQVELLDGSIRLAELHWYECHGIGKKKLKIKKLID